MSAITTIAVRAGIIGLTLLLIAGGDSKPRTFEDCTLKYLKPGMTNSQTGLMVQDCRNKFPDNIGDAPAAPARALTSGELSNIIGRAKPGAENVAFSGTLYNGNPNLKITEIDVKVTEESDDQIPTLTDEQARELGISDVKKNPVANPIQKNIATPVITTGPERVTGKSHIYKTSVSIDPLSAGAFEFIFLAGDAQPTYKWHVINAQGHEVK